MLEGFTPVAIERWGSLVTFWPPEKLPSGVSPDCRNVRFTPSSVLTREGLTRAITTQRAYSINGLGSYVQLNGTQIPLVFDSGGRLFEETPAGSGTLTPITSAQVTPPTNAFMQMATAYNRAYLAFGDGRLGAGAPAQFDGNNLDPIGIAGAIGSATAADSASAGNVCAGQRYGIVMFKTRSGYVTAPQGPFSWTAAGGKQVTISNLPLGPAQVVARVVAFTVAGGSSAGPYFAIGATQNINGVTETSTIVQDNSTTSATFNFDDTFLAASTDYTNAFRKILLPNEAGVLFSASTRRLLWWGEASQPSVLRVSQPDDPETYFGDTGFVEVAQDNGERITACFEFRGQLFVAKERSLYAITPNNGDPATWDVAERSQKAGVCGPRALDFCHDFVIFAHRSGVYLFTGGDPVAVSIEIDNLWKRVNWKYAHLIWVHIDGETKQVRIGVPLDQSSAPSVILKVDYQEGWDAPVVFSHFTAGEHAFPGRKWTVDDIAAYSAVRMERLLTGAPGSSPGQPIAPAGGVDNRLVTSQLMLASANADGAVDVIDPMATTDNGAPINSYYQTAFVSSTQPVAGTSIGIQMLGGVSCSAVGTGSMTIEAVYNDSGKPPQLLRRVELAPDAAGDYKVGCRAQSERIALRFSNQSAQGATFELRRAFAWLRTMWQARV